MQLEATEFDKLSYARGQSHVSSTPPQRSKHPKDTISASANKSCKAKGVSVIILTLLHKSHKLMLHGEKIPGPTEMIQTFSKPVPIWKKKK